jgi:hypothetical protein
MATIGYINCLVIAILVGVAWSIARFDANRAVTTVAEVSANAYQQDVTRRLFTNFVAQWVFGPVVTSQSWPVEALSWISGATLSWVSVATQSVAALGNR